MLTVYVAEDDMLDIDADELDMAADDTLVADVEKLDMMPNENLVVYFPNLGVLVLDFESRNKSKNHG